MQMTTLCYIEKDNKYLMLHRTKKKNDINEGKWIGVGGHAEGSESPEECLKREVKEETNIDVKIDETKRYTMNYITDRGASKEVVLFLAQKIGGNLSRQESEISQIEWLCFDDAISRLSYKNTKDLFKKVVSQL